MTMQPMIVRRDILDSRDVATREGLSVSEQVDLLRRRAPGTLDQDTKAALGQFFTPAPVASLMALMLECVEPTIHILDAGAGLGSLFAAVVDELCGRARKPERIHVTAYELDPGLAAHCRDTMRMCATACAQAGIAFDGEVVEADFIEDAVTMLRGNLFSPSVDRSPFTCAILNPPYRKISSGSRHRKLLQKIDVETSNLYTGFLAAAMKLLAPQGELVAITPRSFCNGPYFRAFREDFLKTMSLRRLHVFDSRNAAFRDDAVLQENVILSARKEPRGSGTICITASTDDSDDLIATRDVSYEQVVHPGDPQSFIRIVPDELGQKITNRMAGLTNTLEALGLSVSTGRVVDFRARELLRQQPGPNTVPLIYPVNVEKGYVAWPKSKSRKPNAVYVCERTDDLLIPNEHYVLVKRFTSKEERRRVVAAIYDAKRMPGEKVGFENHLNYFHRNGRGLSITSARGLAVFLNSTLVDTYFRQFNGHTQVNATDLRNMRYPTLEQLDRLGARVGSEFPDQNMVDALVREEIEGMAEGQEIDPVQAKQRLDEALTILKALGFLQQQQNDRSALTLLALLDLKSDTPWPEASNPLRGITQMMDFFAEHYGKTYAPNTRETVRRQTVHQFLDAGLVRINPDAPGRPTNSGQTVYQIDADALELVRAFGTAEWNTRLQTYLASAASLKEQYAQERRMTLIPLDLGSGKTIMLSPGGQNILVEQIIREFAPRFTPDGIPLYVGDTDEKFAHFDQVGLAALNIHVEVHGKIPDVIIYHRKENWLVLVEAVTSHGPIDPKRRSDLMKLFSASTAPLVFVTAFLTREAMREYLPTIAWESEVWIAESPSHLIHFDGERFLGPRDDIDEET